MCELKSTTEDPTRHAVSTSQLGVSYLMAIRVHVEVSAVCVFGSSVVVNARSLKPSEQACKEEVELPCLLFTV